MENAADGRKMFAERRRSDGLSAAGRVVKSTIPMVIDHLMAITKMAAWPSMGIKAVRDNMQILICLHCVSAPLDVVKSCTLNLQGCNYYTSLRINK